MQLWKPYKQLSNREQPHVQMAPERVRRSARHAYFASMTFVDELLGHILFELRTLRLRESTLTVLHSALHGLSTSTGVVLYACN